MSIEPAAESILAEAEQLVKIYPVRGRSSPPAQALDRVDLQLRHGETLGLVGESGCGKTTLARCLVGLERPTSGSVRFRGADITRMPARELRMLRQQFQIVFQDPAGSLDPRMNVEDILTEGLKAHRVGSDSADRRRLVTEMLEEVGLGAEALAAYPDSFSGGQQQRIGIARALLLRPSLLVADEPVSALDVSVQAQILNLLVRLKAAYGLTMLFVAHDLAVVTYVSDRVAVMYRGRIVEVGDPADIVQRPAHPYTANLLAAVPGTHREGTVDQYLGREDRADAGEGRIVGCRYFNRCPIGQDVCLRTEPELVGQGSERLVACHFAGEVGAHTTGRMASGARPGQLDARSTAPTKGPTPATIPVEETVHHD